MANMVLSSENMENSNRVSTTTMTTTCDDGRTYVFVSNGGGAASIKPSKMAKVGTKRPRADSSSSAGSNPPELMRCKRRINFAAGFSLPHQQQQQSTTSQPPTAVARRNERERNRVKLVNLGFATLREHVPNGSKNKKMSKVETLRSAVEYIRKLQELLDADDGTLDALFADAATLAAAPSSSSALSSASSPMGSPSPPEQNENVIPCSQSSVTSSSSSSSSSSTTSSSLSSNVSSSNTGSGAELCYSIGRNVIGSADGGVNMNMISTSSLTTANDVLNNNGGLVTCPPSSVSPTCSAASSPTPSYTSECSFYEPLSPEEAELLDFTNWFT